MNSESPQQPASKKRRLENNASEIERQLESDSKRDVASRLTRFRRSETIYMDDGNIVLIAEDVAFRVHKGLLAHRSQVFNDMLAVALPDGADQETFDGCPVIVVSDTREQLECLLKFIYKPTQFSPALGVMTLLHIALLGHKYMIDDLTEPAFQALRSLFPDNFEDWLESAGITPEYRDAFSTHELLYAISVARATDRATILPTAFLLLSFEPIRELIANVSSEADLATIIEGRELLSSAVSSRIYILIFSHQNMNRPHSSDCKLKEVGHSLARWTASGMYPRSSKLHATPRQMRNMLSMTRRVIYMIADELCSSCSEEVKSNSPTILRSLWARIPRVFKVPLTPAEQSKWVGAVQQ